MPQLKLFQTPSHPENHSSFQVGIESLSHQGYEQDAYLTNEKLHLDQSTLNQPSSQITHNEVLYTDIKLMSDHQDYDNENFELRQFIPGRVPDVPQAAMVEPFLVDDDMERAAPEEEE